MSSVDDTSLYVYDGGVLAFGGREQVHGESLGYGNSIEENPMKKSSEIVSRRQFLKGAAALTTASAVFPQIVPRHVVGGQGFTPPSETVNVAIIGTGVMGVPTIRSAHKAGARIAALCDVDGARVAPVHAQFSDASLYTDYRRLLEKEKGIDAVIVSTPDHTHATISMPAMELGKHVYCEKPLAHTLYETRLMAEAARKYKVATQLGNQGHSFKAIREFRDCIWSGAIGEVREVHVVAAQYNFSMIDALPRLSESHPVPKTLDWDLWLGPASYRKYHPLYQPGSWRGWRPFGSGMLGDYVCHVVDPVFWALNLGAPASVTAEVEGYDLEKHVLTFPQSAKLLFKFPARGKLPPVTLHWYDGGAAHASPSLEESEDRDETTGIPSWASNRPASALVIGGKGKIIYGPQGAMGWRIVSDSQMKEYMGDRAKAKDPAWPDNLTHVQDWLQACKGWDPAGSNFNYGGPLTEIAMLGNIAHHLPGTELQWDAKRMTFSNQPQANQFLHFRYRDGWSL